MNFECSNSGYLLEDFNLEDCLEDLRLRGQLVPGEEVHAAQVIVRKAILFDLPKEVRRHTWKRAQFPCTLIRLSSEEGEPLREFHFGEFARANEVKINTPKFWATLAQRVGDVTKTLMEQERAG